MAELLELRGASPETTAEPLRRKVSRLHSDAYARMAYAKPPEHRWESWTAADFDTSVTAPFVVVTAWHSSSEPTDRSLEKADELRDKLRILWDLRNAYVHGTRPILHFNNAFRDTIRELSESFSKLALFESEEAEASENAVRVWLDEFDSATRFPVLKHELAHALMLTSPVSNEEEWNEAKNRRRCELVDKEIDGTLCDAEAIELERLQREMLAYRRKLAPLPLEEARELHQTLLQKASKAQEQE